MRLYELIDFLPKVTTRSQHDRNRRISRSSDADYVGDGHFSVVTQHTSPKRLNQVIKSGITGTVDSANDRIGNKDIIDDGYLSYIKMVVEDQSQNPYFPHVHNVKTFRSPIGSMYYDVDMEKLTDLYTHKIISDEMMTSIYDHIFYPSGNKYDDAYEKLVLNFFTACRGDRDLVKDPILLDALSKIDNILHKLNAHGQKYRWDIHAGNVMWRITGNIPQLVIVDPLS